MKRRNRDACPSAKVFKGSETDKAEPQFLNGLKCHVHPANFGLKRRGLFESHVVRYGGELVRALPKSSEAAYHVVFEESVDEEKVKRLVDISKLPNSVFLRCSWLIESIGDKVKASTDRHLIVTQNSVEDVRSDDALRITDAALPKEIQTQEETMKTQPLETNSTLMQENDTFHLGEIGVKDPDSQGNKGHSEIDEKTDVNHPLSGEKRNSNEHKEDTESHMFTTANREVMKTGNDRELKERSEDEGLTSKWGTLANEDNLQSLIRSFPRNLQEKFACARPSSSKPADLNTHITSELEKLAKTYKSKNDTWRAVGYERAISAIRNYSKRITSREEALAIPGIGERLADKIAEILESGRLRKVAEVCDGEEAKTLQLFLGVWGAGPSTAQAWYLQDFRTLEDLRTKATLNRHQQIGLKHYQDINSRIPRLEVEEIENYVRGATCSLVKGAEVMVCGSYRRGKETCGDVDVLITHPDGHSHTFIFRPLLAHLKATGFLTDDLVTNEDNGNQKKYLGVCRLPGEGRKHRRLDIIVVPYDERATALMYFTGSAHFNRSMRLLATKKGMSLSEHTLRAGVMRQGGEKLNEGYVLETPTEESIFAHLGLEYRPPKERDH